MAPGWLSVYSRGAVVSVLSPETLTHLDELLAKASIDWQRPHLGLTNVGEAWKTAGLAGRQDDAELACAAVNALPALLQAARELDRLQTDLDSSFEADAVYARERAERAEREVAQLRQALDEALHHAKKAWFAGRVADDGTPIGEYPVDEFNTETERLRALGVSRPGQDTCGNGPDEQGNWACDPVDNGDGTASCSVCSWTGAWRPGQEKDEQCPFCDGHGSIWTSWGGTKPVQCGHCHGTGREQEGTTP